MNVDKLILDCKIGSPEVKSSAIVDLQELGAIEAIPVLLSLIDFPNELVKANIAETLGVLGENIITDQIKNKVNESLEKLMNDSSSLVRMKAIESLGFLKNIQSINSIIHVLNNDKDSLVRIHAAESLGYIGDLKGLDALVQALDDKDEKVRAYAVDSIGKLGAKGIIPVLLKKLEIEKSLFARGFYFSTLYRLGRENALELLVKLSEKADDRLSITILNLAIELASPHNVNDLKTIIKTATKSRKSLHKERDALIDQLNSLF